MSSSETSLKSSGIQKPPGDSNKESPVQFSMSPGLVAFLHLHDIAIAFTSYQSGKLYLLSRNPKGGLMVNEQFFQKAMGLHVSGKSLYLAALGHIHRLENILDANQLVDETFTHTFLPRVSCLTGTLDTHDVGVSGDDELVFVATRYNCIAKPSRHKAFKQVWRPPFISRLVAEDRCHLNGLAMDNGKPRYVTAACRSDVIDGWRDRRADGGVLIDIESNEIVLSGLSMPHSPRVHEGSVFVLNSGSGELGTADLARGRFEPVAFCPGFVRGLALHKNYAFCGLSRPRYERFEGLALDKRLSDADADAWTGVQVIDINSGNCVEWFRIDGPVAELYDVAVMPGVFCAQSIGLFNEQHLGLITFEE